MCVKGSGELLRFRVLSIARCTGMSIVDDSIESFPILCSKFIIR